MKRELEEEKRALYDGLIAQQKLTLDLNREVMGSHIGTDFSPGNIHAPPSKTLMTQQQLTKKDAQIRGHQEDVANMRQEQRVWSAAQEKLKTELIGCKEELEEARETIRLEKKKRTETFQIQKAKFEAEQARTNAHAGATILGRVLLI